jgi:erythritol kinase
MSVIGLDVGTSRVKAVRFDRSWRATAMADETTAVTHPHSGWSEQDMNEVWSAAARVIAKVAGEPGPAVHDVATGPESAADATVELVAVTGQGDGCWLVDAAGRPVRPAMLWNDARSEPVVDAWERDGTLAQTFLTSGNYGSPGVANAQLRWLTDHEPEVLAGSDTLLSCGSWVFHQLTGRRVLDVSEAVNPFLDVRTGAYDDGLLDAYGLLDQRRLLPPVVSGRDRVAELTANAARSVGLPAGTPIVLAPYDVVATARGSGVARPGQAFAVLGTTLCVGVLGVDPLVEREPNGLTLPTGTPGSWLVAYATMAGTEVLDWTATLMGLAGAADLIALAMNSPMADARPDSLPLVAPYFSPAGERSPFRDSRARGALTGLSTECTRADIARATVDGLTLAVLDCFLACGGADSLAVSGGGARSDLWCHTISDAIGTPVHRVDSSEAGALGAALTGAAELKMFPDIATAVETVVGHGDIFQPDPRRRAYHRSRLAELSRSRAAR